MCCLSILRNIQIGKLVGCEAVAVGNHMRLNCFLKMDLLIMEMRKMVRMKLGLKLGLFVQNVFLMGCVVLLKIS